MSRTLVIDTATAACSVALIEHGRVVAAAHEVIGRAHAERLLPMIAALPGGGRADAVLVDCGPGSFTGLRVGLAAAIGLGIGWGVPVTGYSATALLAAAAFGARPAWPTLAVVLEGGHGEVFVQAFDRSLAPVAPLASLRPDAAQAVVGHRPAVGDGVRHLTVAEAIDMLPDAANAVLLPAEHVGLLPRPIYGRAPDAKPGRAA